MAAIIRQLRDGGTAIWTDGGSETCKRTFTCVHCNCVVIMEHRATAAESGGWCMNCGAAICPRCANDPTCFPFLKRIEIEERRDRMLRAINGQYH